MKSEQVEISTERVGDGRMELTGESYLSCLTKIHDVLQPRTYLEIGTCNGNSLKLAHCSAIAVDPGFQLSWPVPNKSMPALCLFQLPSDGFFKSYDPGAILGAPVDLAFLDGMHLFEYLLRDFINTERTCHKRSLIILHDCVPRDFPMTRRNPNGPERSLSAHPDWWTGDVWKMLPILGRYRSDLRIEVFNAQPTGLVVIGSVDPESRVLADHYKEIVKEFANLPDEPASFAKFLSDLEMIDTSKLLVRDPF